MKGFGWILMVVVVLSACERLGLTGGDEAVESQMEQALSPEKQLVSDLPILLTNVDQLRLRRYCDVKSEMLTTFDENTPLYFTGETTDFEEKIGGSAGPWMRVRTTDNEMEGWVFGAPKFVTTWLESDKLSEIHEAGKDVRIISNLSRSEMAKLTGANFDEGIRGTRYSGYYEYDKEADPQLIDGAVILRARQFDSDAKKVEYLKCSFDVSEGMPSSEIVCVPILSK